MAISSAWPVTWVGGRRLENRIGTNPQLDRASFLTLGGNLPYIALA
jgi:hypothetical protein